MFITTVLFLKISTTGFGVDAILANAKACLGSGPIKMSQAFRACSNEVVQIMKEIWDLVGGNKDPFHHVGNGVENKWGRSKTERENQVHVELVAPLHPQQNAVRRLNRHIAVGRLHVKFGREGPWT